MPDDAPIPIFAGTLDMSVLSDSEIRTRMANGKLVVGGRTENAEECSYAFRAGKGFFAGKEGDGIDFTTLPASTITVDPGKMIWIRTRESVALPNDLVGFWWQTNSLSKKGLMLVNMSMVEPGYHGSLACLFVNFGNQRIVIDDSIAIAKMVFIKIGGPVTSPYTRTSTTAVYDHGLKELSVNQPSSFLQIGDIASSIEGDRQRALQDLQNEVLTVKNDLNRMVSELQAQIKSEFSTQKIAMVDEFKTDAPKAIWKTLGWAAGAILVFGAITAIADWSKDNILPNTEEIANKSAEKVLQDKMIISSDTNDDRIQNVVGEQKAMNDRLHQLETGKSAQ